MAFIISSWRMRSYIIKDHPAQTLRHGTKHRLYDGLRRGDVVLHQPFPRHAEGAVAVEPDAEPGLGVRLRAGLLPGDFSLWTEWRYCAGTSGRCKYDD